ncbi:DUF971 domain-containing protein [Breoghania sp. L-A4]|uniref:gamma-butyrobetaine hydroxylase-like domain-containing protein n=1 Tax=Breoghania sp. L-A4 TaxID=2304600 RepID=UPI0020C0BF25|nr:DUF971 domain-containing protein [Breoghania sp. L-A4]
MSDDKKPWPSELRLSKDKKTLTVGFDSGERFALAAEYLRIASPSAEVQGHSPAQKQTMPGKRDVGIMKIEPVGNYAVKLIFDDMHDTGIFSWDYLLRLGREFETIWGDYLKDLEAKGLKREG